MNALYLMDPRWRPLVYPEDVDRELRQSLTFVAPPQSATSIQEQPERLRDVEVIFTGWGMARLDSALLTAAPRLRAVFHAAGTIRYFATPEMWSRGIVVCTANQINAIPVAEYTLAAILFSLRHGWQHASAARCLGRFDPDQSMPGGYRSTVALISLGAVGRLVRERLRPFDVHVIAYDPFCSEEMARELDLEQVTLEEAFARGDVVSLHTPLLPETEGLIRGGHLSAMKPRATLINTARGGIIREDELISVLQQRPDLHAVLDVTEPEPPVAGSPLYQLPNVVLTPHIAGTCAAETPRMGRAMVEEYQRWRHGLPLRYAVSEEAAARQA